MQEGVLPFLFLHEESGDALFGFRLSVGVSKVSQGGGLFGSTALSAFPGLWGRSFRR